MRVNFLSFLKRVIISYFYFLTDSQSKINWIIDKDECFNSNDDIFVFSEYNQYPQIRTKTVRKLSYICNRANVIATLKKKPINKLLIVTTNEKFEVSDELKKELYPHFDKVILTNNVGQDIGSYICASKYLRQFNFNRIIIMNSSQFLGKKYLKKYLDIKPNNNSYVGISYAYGPRFFPLKRLHIQSFSFIFKFSDFLSIFNKISPDGRFYSSKYRLISNGEIKISTTATQMQLRPYIFNKNNIIPCPYKEKKICHYDHRETLFRDNLND